MHRGHVRGLFVAKQCAIVAQVQIVCIRATKTFKQIVASCDKNLELIFTDAASRVTMVPVQSSCCFCFILLSMIC